ncbi:MAG: Hsp70 family protein [Deltaproteobacteria bacterium]|nr:Hsp70 family protein [Deltaproteobacteria bacterium]
MSNLTTRQERRFPAAIPVEVTVTGPAQVHALWTENISKGGLFVRSETPLDIGTRLEIRLKGDELDVTLGAEVAHVVDRPTAERTGAVPGLGVRFLELHPDVAIRLLEYIGALEPSQPSYSSSPSTTSHTSHTSHTSNNANAQKVASGSNRSNAGWVLGIDLGTSNTAAYARGPGDVRGVSVFRSDRNRGPILPSVVSLKNLAQPLVGWSALDMQLTDPLTTIYGWKRFLGRSERSEFVERHRVRFPYRVGRDARGELGVIVHDRVVSFIDVAALVLSEVKMGAWNILQRDIEDAVVTVPAHFSTAQRRAVIEAGRRAGLNVRKLVNEPTAAALSLGAGRSLDTRMLVFDLGGGTFDASILEVLDDVFDVKMTSGDSFLGGLDFDRAVAKRLTDMFAAKHRIDLSEEPILARRVLNAAEYAKILLSEHEATDVRVPLVGYDTRGKPIDLEHRLTRAELETLTAPLVERCIGIVEDMLAQAQVSAGDLEAVVLVGGQTRMPLVRSRLERVIGSKIHNHPDGDPAVAKGAAIVGAALDDLGGAILMDVLAVPVGIMVAGGETKWVFPKGSQLPAKRSVTLDSTPAGATAVAVAIWEGADLAAADRHLLGVVHVPSEMLRSGAFELEVQLSADLTLAVQGRAGARVVSLAVETPTRTMDL